MSVRVNIFGKVLQVLEKGIRPTSVAMSNDDKLWVGYRDKNVIVYQLKDKYLSITGKDCSYNNVIYFKVIG